MSRKQERARAHRRGSARHSNTMADGRGDPRDHRREEQRLTSDDIDPRYFSIVNGQLTLELDPAALAALLAPIAGRGLSVAADGSFELKLGATLALDKDGRVSVRFAAIDGLTDDTDGTASSVLTAIPDPANTPASADALRDDLVANTLPTLRNAIASLAAKVNAILAAATTNVRP